MNWPDCTPNDLIHIKFSKCALNVHRGTARLTVARNSRNQSSLLRRCFSFARQQFLGRFLNASPSAESKIIILSVAAETNLRLDSQRLNFGEGMMGSRIGHSNLSSLTWSRVLLQRA